MGANVKFYFTDAINNGAMNFVMWDVNLLEKKAAVKISFAHRRTGWSDDDSDDNDDDLL